MFEPRKHESRLSKFCIFHLEGLFLVRFCSLSLPSTRSLLNWKNHFKLQNIAVIGLRTQIFSWRFEHVFTLKLLLEHLKRYFDASKLVLFSLQEGYRFLISTCYFAHLDGLSAENMIREMLSSAICI